MASQFGFGRRRHGASEISEWNARKVFVGLWLTITLICWTAAAPLFANSASVAVAVDSIGMTVSDMDRSVTFYSNVLAFKFISDVEVDGPEYDQLWGIFGVQREWSVCSQASSGLS